MIYDNVIFVHIPRTGGTSIENSFGMDLESHEKHLTALDIRQNVGEEHWENSFVFTFVRNPWDRVISAYHQPYFRNINCLTNKSLEFFLANYQPPDWEKKFFHEYLNTGGITFCGKFENRTKDLLKIVEITGLAIDTATHERKTARNPDYRSYYNNNTAQIVYETYKDDIIKYNYTF